MFLVVSICSYVVHWDFPGCYVLTLSVHSYLRSEARLLRRDSRGCVYSQRAGVCTPNGTHSEPCMHSFHSGMAALAVGQPFDTGAFDRACFQPVRC